MAQMDPDGLWSCVLCFALCALCSVPCVVQCVCVCCVLCVRLCSVCVVVFDAHVFVLLLLAIALRRFPPYRCFCPPCLRTGKSLPRFTKNVLSCKVDKAVRTLENGRIRCPLGPILKMVVCVLLWILFRFYVAHKKDDVNRITSHKSYNA